MLSSVQVYAKEIGCSLEVDTGRDSNVPTHGYGTTYWLGAHRTGQCNNSILFFKVHLLLSCVLLILSCFVLQLKRKIEHDYQFPSFERWSANSIRFSAHKRPWIYSPTDWHQTSTTFYYICGKEIFATSQLTITTHNHNTAITMDSFKTYSDAELIELINKHGAENALHISSTSHALPTSLAR